MLFRARKKFYICDNTNHENYFIAAGTLVGEVDKLFALLRAMYLTFPV